MHGCGNSIFRAPVHARGAKVKAWRQKRRARISPETSEEDGRDIRQQGRSTDIKDLSIIEGNWKEIKMEQAVQHLVWSNYKIAGMPRPAHSGLKAYLCGQINFQNNWVNGLEKFKRKIHLWENSYRSLGAGFQKTFYIFFYIFSPILLRKILWLIVSMPKLLKNYKHVSKNVYAL